MAKRRKQSKEDTLLKISNALELPSDTLTGYFHMELVGMRELTIDEHCGILTYSEDTIQLAVKNGIITIGGTSLEIRAMSDDGIYVCGRIRSVEYTEA